MVIAIAMTCSWLSVAFTIRTLQHKFLWDPHYHVAALNSSRIQRLAKCPNLLFLSGTRFHDAAIQGVARLA